MVGMSRSRRSRGQGKPCRRCALLLVICLAGMATGCYGKFPVTRAIYRLNGEASDSKLVKSAVMWVFAIPLYGTGATTDVAVFNLVEFWTGATLDLGDERQPQPQRQPYRRRYALAPAGVGTLHFAAEDGRHAPHSQLARREVPSASGAGHAPF